MGDGKNYGNGSSIEKYTRVARSVVLSVKMSIRGLLSSLLNVLVYTGPTISGVGPCFQSGSHTSDVSATLS